MNYFQVFLGLATCCLLLVSANKGSYNNGNGLNLPASGQSTSFSYKSSISQSPIVVAVAAPQYNAEDVPDCDPAAQKYDLDAPAASISVTASPILETKMEAEPIAYAPLTKFAPIPRYEQRSEYLAASPTPLVASRMQDSVVQIQATTSKIINPEPILQQSYSTKATSSSYRSSIDVHQQIPIKIATAEPQYYAAAPQYNLDTPISVTASPILETKIEDEPIVYSPRPEYLAASPAPLIESRMQDSVVQIQATPAKIINSEQILQSLNPQVTSFSYKSSVSQNPIEIATTAPQYNAEAAPDCDPAAPQYDLDTPAASISVTASPILETKIEAEPISYAPLPKFAPLSRYEPRPEYLAASLTPLVASRKQQDSVVQIKAPTVKIIKPEPILQLFNSQATSSSYRSFAPQYYAAAPAAPEYYLETPTSIALRMVKPLVQDRSALLTYQYNNLRKNSNQQQADYLAAYQPIQQNIVVTTPRVHNSVLQFDDQEQPCEK